MLERFDADRVLPENLAHEQFRQHHLRLYELAARFLAATRCRDLRIVDAASGLGFGYDYLAPYGHYVGLDISPEAVNVAQRRRPSATYLVRDLEDIQTFRELSPIDVLVSFETAEHLIDPDRFLRCVRTTLRPESGYLLFSAPTCLTRDFDPYHRHDRTVDQWRSTLIRAGFVVLAEELMAFTTPFRQFCRTIPTTWRQKAWIVGFLLLHPGYGWNRLWNWLVQGRFVWTSHYFACRVRDPLAESRPFESTNHFAANCSVRSEDASWTLELATCKAQLAGGTSPPPTDPPARGISEYQIPRS
jgi:2-polyprenyl-3-methyl-5-hydroxy-6-metoxy-1,4-benzoquinol methylase